MQIKIVKPKYILPLFLLFQVLFLKVIAFFPDLVERYYSDGLYVFISKINRTIFGFFSFSVGDILYGILIIYGIYWLYKNRKTHWKQKIISVLSFISVLYFLFHFLWALNYYRLPLAEKMKLKTEYTTPELVGFTKKLVEKTNKVHIQITHNASLPVTVPYSQETIFKMTLNGYSHLAQDYPFFGYAIPSQKKSLYSLPLTYMGFAGYLNPFTGEAQVNDKLPLYGFPNVICHEMAHQIGYGSESECNFIGFLAATKNEDLYFQYSAYATALRYCLNTLTLLDEKESNGLQQKINPGILANYEESEAFWKQYDTFIDQGFHAFYDQYLKLNQQKDGMESYSRYVDLLVNYYKSKSL